MYRTLLQLTLAIGILMIAHSAFAETRPDGSFLHEITDRYMTPYLDWTVTARELAPKVLFIVPRKGAREVVELGQRMPLQRTAVVSHSPFALFRDSIYEGMVTGTSKTEKHHELARKLQGKFDVIVLANVSFKALSTEAQYQILEKVSEGAGLILSYPRDVPEKVLSASTDGAKQILQMIDIASLPDNANLNAAKLLQTFRFGKGKIAALNYPVSSASISGGAALTAFEPYEPIMWKTHYENNMALLIRTMQWAAGQNIAQIVRPQFPAHISANSKVLLPLDIQNISSVKLRIRDAWNYVKRQEEISGNTAQVELPPLAAGTYYLDVFGDTVGTFRFEVNSSIGNVQISTDKESYEHGENVSVKVLFTQPLQHDSEIEVRLQSLPDRKIWYKQSKVLLANKTNAEFTLQNIQLPSIAGAIVADIRQDDITIQKAEEVAFFPRRKKEIFPKLLWDTVQAYQLPFYQHQYIGNMDDPSGLTHPDGKGEVARRTALANQRFVPYMTRIGLSAGKEGQTLNNHWLGMSKEEIENATGGEGSFNDPAVRAFWKENIRRRIEGVPRVGPMIYTLGDENGFSYEAGYSPADNAAWPLFLQSMYGSIATLNKEWNTNYAIFKDVPHDKPDKTREERNFPAWYAQRRFMEKQYADIHHFLSETIKEIDPHALVGAEGSQPGELEQTINGLDFWGPYSDAVQDELLRSIGEEKMRMLWWGYGPARVKDGPYQLWAPLLKGTVNGSAFYTSNIDSQGLLSVDLSYPDYYEKIRPALRQLDQGQAPALIKAPLKKDGIAILWSHASYSASLMDDRFTNPGSSAVALMNFCYRTGLNFDYLTSKSVEEKGLKGYKVLFLFGATALSTKEAIQIEHFVQNGGTVIADLYPAILSEYLRPLGESRLASLFGTPTLQGNAALQMKPLRLETTWQGQKIKLESANTFQSPEVPVFAARKVGKGNTVLLNFNLGLAHDTAQDKSTFDVFLLNLLRPVHIAPQVTISGLSDQTVLRIREDKNMQVIGLLASPLDIGRVMSLQLPSDAWIYEVNGGFLAHANHLQQKMDTPFKIYSIYKDEQNAPQFSLAGKQVKRGEKFLLNLSQLKPDGLYRLDIFSPKGEVVHGRTRIFTGDTAKDWEEAPFAFNDAYGIYQIRLTDVRTGLQMTETINVN